MTPADSTASHDETALQRALTALAESPLGNCEKGFIEQSGSTPAQVSAARLAATTLTHPVAILRDDRLEHNIRLFAAWADANEVVVAPHVKTTMCAQIVARQLRAGAWGVTVATASQAGTMLECGARRVIIASEVVDPAEIRQIAQWHRDFPSAELYLYVDSPAGAQLLNDAFARASVPRQVPVLIEVGTAGGRAGVRTEDECRDLIGTLARCRALRVAGCAGFEGILAGDRSEASVRRVEEYLDKLLFFASIARERCEFDGSDWIVSAGGSIFPDVVARTLSSRADHDFPRQVIVRSGGYVVSDHGYIGIDGPQFDGRRLREALTVRARVLSIPAPGLAILGVGKRDIGTDLTLPFVERLFHSGVWKPIEGHAISAVNDQHSYLTADAALDPRIEVGSIIELGISHPCTTFDRWRRVALIDPDDRLIDVYTTHF